MDLTFSGATEDTVLILSMTPVVYHQGPASPDWALLDLTDECGGSDVRLLEVMLRDNEGEVVDRGHTLVGPPDKEFPPNGLGDTFTVSDDEPVTLRLKIEGCYDNLYAFGLDVKYLVNDNTYTLRLGSAENPYRIIGTEAHALYASSGEPGANQVWDATVKDFASPDC